MESIEASHVSDIAEDLSNDDEPPFTAISKVVQPAIAVVAEPADEVPSTGGVFVSSPVLLTTTNSLQQVKTTRIVIPRNLSDGIKTPTLLTPLTPITPGTPSTPGSAGVVDFKTGFRYAWDPTVHDEVLPVRCKSTNGQLHKSKFGSGSRGKCIKIGESWFTPSEFEALGGRAGSKDWKRSIRYGGRTVQCLIEEGILQPHAASCTCSACCDDDSIVGPARLFVPYKRRKVKEVYESSNAEKPYPEQESSRSPPLESQNFSNYVTLTPTSLSSAPTFTISTPCTTTTPAEQPSIGICSTVNFAEQKQWWQLEEMVNNLNNCGQQLRMLLDQVKEQSITSKEIALQQLRTQMEDEKRAAIEAVRQEAQTSIKKILMESNNENKDVISKKGVEIVHAGECEANVSVDTETSIKNCANCNRDAVAECTGCHKVSYCSQFCQRKDWGNHIADCERDDIILIEQSILS